MSSREIWAAGYASSPQPVDRVTWTRWQREIETYAHTHGLRMTGVFTDRPEEPAQPAEPGAAPDADPGLRKLVGLIRERAHLRARHISVLLVPSIAHLAPGRDGTHDIVRNLLELHFGLRVQEVVTAAAAQPASLDTPVADNIGPLLVSSIPVPPGTSRPPVAAADRSRFQQILHGTAPAGTAAAGPAARHMPPPIAGKPVTTSLRGLAGFQSPGFIPASTHSQSSPGARKPR